MDNHHVSSTDFDLIVIGAGSGGVRAARMAASYGARVAICEDRLFGGTCVNLGCIPKKFLVYASQFSEECQVATEYGWSVTKGAFDFLRFQEKKDQELKRLQSIYRGLMDKAGVTILDGTASFVSEQTVSVGARHYQASSILLATGGEPFVPDIPGHELGITSDDLFALKTLPKRLTIVGGGYIAVEIASVMHHLGVQTTIAYRGDLFLRGFDDDLRRGLRDELDNKGVQLLFDTQVERLEKSHSGTSVHFSNSRTHETDLVLFATGRRPRTTDLNLADVGIKQNQDGFIEVNESFQTSVPHIYAVGDVTGGEQLTPVALREGMVLAARLFAPTAKIPNNELTPTAVFSQPPLACVGLTEEEARAQFDEVDVYRAVFTPLKYTLCTQREKVCVKMLVDRASDRVLGCHMMGEAAPEIIQGLAVALSCGATKGQFDETLGIHPTSAEEFVTMRTPVSHA